MVNGFDSTVLWSCKSKGKGLGECLSCISEGLVTILSLLINDWSLLQNHRITEWLGLERTLQSSSSNPL